MHRPRGTRLATAVAVLVLLGACASRGPAPREGRDGPESRPPAGLDSVPDAVPRVEALRVGGPNKPYEVLGQRYTPMTADAPLQESGLASWYGRKFHGLPTASGETYDMYAMTAAHKTMPLPSYARVRNPANGREVIVRVNDRGPFAPGRVIDLSYTAALKLGVLGGVAPVQVQRITHAEIRAGLPAPPPVASLPADDPAPGDAAAERPGWWVQLGAFRQRESALALQQRALALADGEGVALRESGGLLRVQAGPYATREAAERAAQRLGSALDVSRPTLERR